MKYVEREVDLDDYPGDYTRVNIGDSIKWKGTFYSGYQEGVNEVVSIVLDFGSIWFILDNSKRFIIADVNDDDEAYPSSILTKGWEVINDEN